MIKSFIKHYLELPIKSKKIICLGGGVGTAQVLKGLRKYSHQLTAVVSMADDGGSAGRLRRAFSVPPPGDLVNCLAALSAEESVLKDLLLYRFAGSKNSDTELGGHKLGNLIFVALTDIYKGNTSRALAEFSKIFSSIGLVLPATVGDVNIWAETQKNQKIYGEQNIDLGKYNRNEPLKKVYIDPQNAKAYAPTIEALEKSEVVIAGPGDLFTTTLPVLIVPEIKSALKKSQANKIFIVNIANKPFETAKFKASDYLKTIKNHLKDDIFDTILVNSNHRYKIPTKLMYTYVQVDRESLTKFKAKIIEGDFVSQNFPLYHDSEKIASAVNDII